MLTAPTRRASLLVICLLLAVASCVRPGRSLPGIDTAGGTILVYEVRRGENDKTDKTIGELARVIRRRIDPNETAPITVRSVAESGIEIVVIREGDQNAEQHRVDQVKKLIEAEPLGLVLTRENAVEPK